MKTRLKLAIIAIVLLNSCNNSHGKKFSVTKIEKNGLTSLSFSPNVNLKKVKDSATFYYTQEDYALSYQADLHKGDIIYSSNNYNLRVMARDYFTFNKVNYEFLLRTFTLDGKIIDTFSLSYIIDEKSCEGMFDGSTTVIRTCNGKKEVFKINDQGKFILQP